MRTSKLLRARPRGSALVLVCAGAACTSARQGPQTSEPVPALAVTAGAKPPKPFDAARLPAGDGFWCFSRGRVSSKGSAAPAYERCLRTQEDCGARRAELIDRTRADALLGDDGFREALVAATTTCTAQPRAWCTTRGPEDVTELACKGAGDCGKSSPLWFCTVTKEACVAVVDHLKSLLSFSVCEERP